MYYISINSLQNFEQTLYSSATDGGSKFLWCVETYYQNKQTNFPEYSNLHSHHHMSLKSQPGPHLQINKLQILPSNLNFKCNELTEVS
jgi:hypothetical protein